MVGWLVYILMMAIMYVIDHNIQVDDDVDHHPLLHVVSGHLFMFGQGIHGQSGIVPRKDHLLPGEWLGWLLDTWMDGWNDG